MQSSPVVAALLLVAWVMWQPALEPVGQERDEPSTTPIQRWREGEQVELTGTIEITPASATLRLSDPPTTIHLLENLALERIAETQAHSAADRPWLVSGVITEYRGANYLLVRQAVQRLPAETDRK